MPHHLIAAASKATICFSDCNLPELDLKIWACQFLFSWNKPWSRMVYETFSLAKYNSKLIELKMLHPELKPDSLGEMYSGFLMNLWGQTRWKRKKIMQISNNNERQSVVIWVKERTANWVRISGFVSMCQSGSSCLTKDNLPFSVLQNRTYRKLNEWINWSLENL